MKIAIIGAGITGLSLAQTLLKNAHNVTIFDKGKPGGLAGGFKFPDIPESYIEKYYHHIFKSDTEILKLIEETGLKNNLKWMNTKSGLYASGKEWSFESPLDLMRFAHISSFWQRLLIGINMLYFKHLKNWRKLDNITCRDFFEKRRNVEGFEKLWLPLLQQKFGKHRDRIPASFLWGRINPRAKSRENGRESLGYLMGGFPKLFDSMIENFKIQGVKIKTGESVRKITYGSTVTVETANSVDEFDKIIWTLPSYRMSGIIQDMPRSVKNQVTAIKYTAVSCLVLSLKRRLGSFYWLNNIDSDLTFGGLIEHTLFVHPREYAGRHILYVVNYHDQASPLSSMNHNELLKYHEHSLKAVYGENFTKNEIYFKAAFHDTDSSPIYDIGYSSKIPSYEAIVKNVYICNMEQVYPYDRNMNNCIANAKHFLKKNRME